MLNRQVQDEVADETFRTPQGLALAKLLSRYWATEMRLCATEDNFADALTAAATACYFSSLSYGVYSVQTALHIYSISKLLMLQGTADSATTTAAMLEGQRTLRKTILAYYAPYVIGVQTYCRDNHAELTDELLNRFRAEFARSERLREEGERLSFQADIKEAIQHLVFSIDHIEKQFGETSPEFTECCIETALCLEIVEDPGRQGYVSKAWEVLRLNGEGGQDPALLLAFRMALPG